MLLCIKAGLFALNVVAFLINVRIFAHYYVDLLYYLFSMESDKLDIKGIV